MSPSQPVMTKKTLILLKKSNFKKRSEDAKERRHIKHKEGMCGDDVKDQCMKGGAGEQRRVKRSKRY